MKIEPMRVIPSIDSEKKLITCCDAYFKNHWYTSRRYPTIYISWQDLWRYQGPNRSWSFQHQALVSVSHLVDAFRQTGREAYLHKAKEIIFHWYQVNVPEAQAEMAWHDHATAWRLVHICHFYVEWEKIEQTKTDLELLKEIVNVHAEKLASEEFYMPRHNHGLDQDMALFTATFLFSDLSHAEEWKQLAFKRFEKQLDHLFGKDGSYLEHSPQYAHSLLKNLYSFTAFLYQIDKNSAEALALRLEKTLSYLIYILQPDGEIPSVGDSENFKISIDLIRKWQTEHPELKQVLEKLILQSPGLGKYTTKMPLDQVFFDAGMASLRNKWEFTNDTAQIIMYSGFHSRVHKHYDDLSFIFFRNGIPLITEGGKYNYDYQSEGRKYIVSPLAHNSVMVDEQPSEIMTANIEKSGLTSSLLTKNISYLSGMHALYQKVNHRRMLVYFKPDVLLVIDKLDGTSHHTFDTFFNLHPDLQTVEEEQAVTGYLNNVQVIKIQNLYTESGEVEQTVTRGETSPLKGWISPGYNELEPNALIQYRAHGQDAFNIYQITTGPNIHHNVKVIRDHQTLKVKWKNYTVKIQLTDFFEHIHINDKYYRTQKRVKPKLIESIIHTQTYRFLNN